MSRRKTFFADAESSEADLARQRNLEALIAPHQVTPQNIPIDRIQTNPYQARQRFDNLDELAEAMRQQGFITRLRVRPAPNQEGVFQLVFGERRLRAARLAGLATIPCEVAKHTDDELIEIGLAENVQRCDLAPLEEAQAFRTFIDQRGYSIRRLAERIGKDKSYIEDRLKLLTVPGDVQAMVEQRHDTVQVAREIAKIDSLAERQTLIDGVVSGELTKADVREIVRDAQRRPANADINETALPSDNERAKNAAATRVMLRAIERDGVKIQSILERWREQTDQREVREAICVNLEEIAHACNVMLKETSPRLLAEEK